MRRHLTLIVLSLVSCICRADDLADGTAAWEKQDYPKAYAIFSRLAAAGDARAQLQVGEMTGFGEGVPEDPDKAQQWLALSLAAGNADAAASIATLKRRREHKADIARYTDAYDGEDIRLSKFGCVKPVVPEVSKTKASIKTVSAEVAQWFECYGRFARNLSGLLPAGKAIPADIANIMSTTEFARARARMDKVYADAAMQARAEASALSAAEGAWVKASGQYVEEAKKVSDNFEERYRRDQAGYSAVNERGAPVTRVGR